MKNTKYSKLDTIQEPHDIRVTHEEGEIYRYKRTTLSYLVGHASKVAEIRTSELDALSLLFLSSKTKNLFENLVSAGFNSTLIEHFAECERQGVPYSDPRSGKTLFVKGHFLEPLSTENSPNPALQDSEYNPVVSVESSNPLITQYRLSGGMSTFYNIVEYDADFFPNILKGIDQKFCKITRLDMCTDLSDDIMSLVSDSVKKGRVNSFGCNLKGFGLLNGVPFNDRFVGKWSAFYKTFKKENCKFSLETLYCGHPQRNSCVIVFYDKRKEASKRHVNYLDGTRIEIRLYSGKDDKYSPIINELLKSLTQRDSFKVGQFLRHAFFTQLLFSHINFSNSKEAVNPFESLKSWAGWWEELFKVKYKACLTNKNEFYSLLPSILSNLRSLKANPLNIFGFYNREFQKIESGCPLDSFNLSKPLLITSGLESKESEIPLKKALGRPKGRLDSKKFETRGRPKK